MDETEDKNQQNSAPNQGAGSPSSEAQKSSQRPSDRMFRRSRRALEQRRAAERKDARFVRFIFTLSLLTTLIVFLIIYFFSGQLASAAPASDTDLTAPILGKYSILDLGGFIFVAIAGYAVYRRFQSKD